MVSMSDQYAGGLPIESGILPLLKHVLICTILGGGCLGTSGNVRELLSLEYQYLSGEANPIKCLLLPKEVGQPDY